MFLLVFFLAVMTGCADSGQSVPSMIQQENERALQVVSGTTKAKDAGEPIRRPVGYQKRKGLHIDMPFLAGRRLSELTEEVIADQLGVAIEVQELPENESHAVYDKVDLWLHDGRIYRIRKELSHPMDVPTALGTSGFPLDLGTPIESSNELRWNHTWNMRRIRLVKSKQDSRLYVQIEVYGFLPKEFF